MYRLSYCDPKYEAVQYKVNYFPCARHESKGFGEGRDMCLFSALKLDGVSDESHIQVNLPPEKISCPLSWVHHPEQYWTVQKAGKMFYLLARNSRKNLSVKRVA
jgi:hypothetical protein